MAKIRVIRGFVIGGVGVLFIVALATAGVAPETTRLLKVSGVNNFPSGIVSDPYGNIYIADSIDKSIKIYNHKGALIDSLRLDFKPLSVGLSPEGYLYVGGKGRLEIYSGSTLINSYRDIVEAPLSIAFLNGKVYVADGYWVKVFDSKMNKINEFGGYSGSDGIMRNGRFNGLRSLAVDYNNSQIYALDSGAIAMENGYRTYVWRVQVFDENGNFIRSFSRYGFGVEGRIGSASSIAVDNESRVYVADNAQNIIGVYDSHGAYLKTIYDRSDPLYTPTKLSFTNNRLYIASGLAKSFYVLGIDLYALLRVEPLSLELTSQGAPVSGSVVIYNDGTGGLNFNAGTSTPWLTLSPASGLLPAGSSIVLNVRADPSGLSQGQYKGSIEITSNGGSETVNVILNIVAPPRLSVSPAVLDILKKRGSPVSPSIVEITLSNDLSGSLTWTATPDVPWITIIPSSGNSNSTTYANILVDTNLDPGKYTGHVRVVASGAEGSPATITVNLEIKTSRRITVTSNIETASFTIRGPATYEGSGRSYVIEDPPPGTYTITFKPVKGYKRPPSQTGTLPSDGELAFSGDYSPYNPVILASHGPGKKDNMEIRVFDPEGNLLGTYEPLEDFPYGATTALGDIDGDGINELIIGTGPGPKVPAVVTVTDLDGNLIARLRPFGTGDGVEVSTADLDGDGRAEIITAKTRRFAERPSVDLKIFKYNGTEFIDTGLTLNQKGGNGIRIATADIDSNNIPELLLVPARGKAEVQVYRVNTSSYPWKAEPVATYDGCGGSGGSNISAGDTDGDGVPEIILTCQYDTGTAVRILNASGEPLKEFPTGSFLKDYVSAGDLDGDGIVEIIIGDGPSAHSKSVRIFNPQGDLLRHFDAFEDSFGVRISTGELQ